MMSYEGVAQALRKMTESVQVKSVEDFIGLHQWLVEQNHVGRNEATVIVLHGASYVIYADYPATTLVVHTSGTASEDTFKAIADRHMFGAYGEPYGLRAFLKETLEESWVASIAIVTLSAFVAVYASAKLDFLIDKSIDVAAISAAFLGIFLSFKTQPSSSDALWFRKGVYRKHFRVDKYSLLLMASAIAMLFVLTAVSPILDAYCWGRAPTFLLLGTSWYMLYVGFRLVVTYHIDQLETEGEKDLADGVRDALRGRSRRP